nr:transposase [Streptomyces sp. 2231.1]
MCQLRAALGERSAPPASLAGRQVASRRGSSSRSAGQYLWRAVDSDGNVSTSSCRAGRARARPGAFSRKLLTKTGRVPQVVVTDARASCDATHREVMFSAMKGFRRVGTAQRFRSAFFGISRHFRPVRATS